MSPFDQDRAKERERYDKRAQAQLAQSTALLGPDGAISQPLIIRRPYVVYEDFIRRSTRQGSRALDLCCGTGLYSLIAASAGATVTASDIAEHNLLLAQQRAARAAIPLETVVADAEHMPLPDASFDLLTCAGSLSYVDIHGFLNEVVRLLRPGGWFICVDSLNHNPVYRANRYWNYLRGRRTRSTLRRMPTLATVALLQDTFIETETSFHGSLSFLAPLLKPIWGESRTASRLDAWDDRHPAWRRWAFKFVFRGRKRV